MEQHTQRVLRKIFRAQKEEVSGDWRKLQHEAEYCRGDQM
jgi:hypothetical protein